DELVGHGDALERRAHLEPEEFAEELEAALLGQQVAADQHAIERLPGLVLDLQRFPDLVVAQAGRLEQAFTEAVFEHVLGVTSARRSSRSSSPGSGSARPAADRESAGTDCPDRSASRRGAPRGRAESSG